MIRYIRDAINKVDDDDDDDDDDDGDDDGDGDDDDDGDTDADADDDQVAATRMRVLQMIHPDWNVKKKQVGLFPRKKGSVSNL